jgi:ABC-type sugar transport system substrate-binding protein
MKDYRPTLAVDFDGVINTDDVLVEGCAAALRQLSKRYKMVVFTARGDLDMVHAYLVANGIRQHFKGITNRKPNAEVYLDDRGLKFTSWEQALVDLYAA